jgi:hypothetical protein
MVAVTPKLNSMALITPAALKMLSVQANVYQVSLTTPDNPTSVSDSSHSQGGGQQ